MQSLRGPRAGRDSVVLLSVTQSAHAVVAFVVVCWLGRHAGLHVTCGATRHAVPAVHVQCASAACIYYIPGGGLGFVSQLVSSWCRTLQQGTFNWLNYCMETAAEANHAMLGNSMHTVHGIDGLV
jgi:hypothetical protein